MSENFLYELYTHAKKNEDLTILISLLENSNKIKSIKRFEVDTEIHRPETLGDYVILTIFNIIEKNAMLFDNDNRIITLDTDSTGNLISSMSLDTDDPYSNKDYYFNIDKIFLDIEKNDLINKMFWLLLNGSETKKDCAILILLKITKSKKLLKFMHSKQYIKALINYVNSNKDTETNKKYKEHVIIALQLLRIIYVTDVSLRVFFLSAKGLNLMTNLIKLWDPEILTEVIINCEDLIFTYDDMYKSLSRFAIHEIVEILSKLDFESILIEIYNVVSVEKEKYASNLDNLNRIISIFYQQKMLGNSINLACSFEIE